MNVNTRIRVWILERARDHGWVTTREVADHFRIGIKHAAGRVAHLRRDGLLEAIEEQRPEHGPIRSVITDAGEYYIAHPPQPVRKMDALPLARALGYSVHA